MYNLRAKMTVVCSVVFNICVVVLLSVVMTAILQSKAQARDNTVVGTIYWGNSDDVLIIKSPPPHVVTISIDDILGMERGIMLDGATLYDVTDRDLPRLLRDRALIDHWQSDTDELYKPPHAPNGE